jgi:hypothetical protein
LVEKVVRRVSVENSTEQLAWVVLRAANRAQARGSTVRLVVPRAPEVTNEMVIELTEAQLRTVEEYLLDLGYVADAGISLAWSAYTLTPAGLRWLETSLPEPLLADRVHELAARPDEDEAFESALRAELEEERRRMQDLERELGEEPSEVPENTTQEQKKAKPRSIPGETQEGADHGSWWRRVFGGGGR